jgi:hypothetical protein
LQWSFEEAVAIAGSYAANHSPRPVEDANQGKEKKWSMINVQLSFVIFGCAFGAASLTNDCAKRHHR